VSKHVILIKGGTVSTANYTVPISDVSKLSGVWLNDDSGAVSVMVQDGTWSGNGTVNLLEVMMPRNNDVQPYWNDWVPTR
jgi:hypothetical protein